MPEAIVDEKPMVVDRRRYGSTEEGAQTFEQARTNLGYTDVKSERVIGLMGTVDFLSLHSLNSLRGEFIRLELNGVDVSRLRYAFAFAKRCGETQEDKLGEQGWTDSEIEMAKLVGDGTVQWPTPTK